MLKDAVACLAVALAVIVLTIYFHGAPLGPPADPANEFPARPEWYFLFLFQLLKYVPAFWGAIIIPAFVVLLMFAQPFIGKSEKGHRFNIGFLWCLLIGAGALTFLAFSEDRANKKHFAAVEEADWLAKRVVDIADKQGIPPSGAVTLLREDLEGVLATLSPRERDVLRLRYGLDDGRMKTLEEIGQIFDVTRERIRQIEAKALRKLRHPNRNGVLKEYIK